MESLYDDLSNYEDVNAVVELREENKELKVKLQEYAAAMEKLQKDYDKLELEFKMLEHNYSSLLKTARSEVERKTKMITELNTQKDSMVLEALKSGKKIRRNFNKPMSNINRERVQHDKYNKEKGNDKHVKEEPPQKNIERKETTILPSQDRFPESGTCTRNKYEKTSAKADYSDRKSNVKENMPHLKTEHYNPLQLLAGSIKNRRKSMPAASAPSGILSSDEDFERNIKTKDTRCDNKSLNKISLDRHSNRNTESSNLDDRLYNYQGSSSRDMHKGRTSRYDIPAHRGRENYEVPSRYRKHPSPERGQKRLHRDHQDDYHRQEQRRYQGRSFESPPKSHSRHRQRLTENRSNYEKQSYDQEKHRYQYEDKQNSTKHRQSSEYDEPLSKRQRTEPLSHSDTTYFKEDKRHYPETQPACTQPMPTFSPHEYDSIRFSCQSPDSVHTESTISQPVKEIMAVAAIPLEDPRLSSLKYVVVKENGEGRLSTRVGQNVDLKPIDKSYYDVHSVNVPTALVRRPSTDSIISDIYRDVDNPIINTSFESGEVRETDKEYHDIYDRPKQSNYETQSKQVKNNFPKQTKNVEKPVSQPSLEKYVIPKIGQNSTNTSTSINVPINYPCETSHNKNMQKKGVPEDSFPRKSLSSERINEGPVSFPDKNGVKKENQSQITLNKMAMVAGDLELSDDTSDNVEINKHVVQEQVEKSCESLTNINKEKKETESSTPLKISVATKPLDDVDIKITPDDVVKKQKSKKSKGKSKSKEISKDSVESLEDKCHPEMKVRTKKDKETKPKKTKDKFSDLFGDSNSLVTPEDLGIPSYLPISEDAQDAVDMKIDKVIDASPPHLDKEEIPLVQTQSATLMKETTTACDVLKATESTENHELPSPTVYENLNPGIDSNYTDVVKTVIISTGVQPEITFDVNRQVIRNPTDHSMPADVNSKPTALEYKKHDDLKALATSTPQKEFTAKHSIESKVETMDSASKSDVVKAVLTISNAEPVTKPNDVNTVDSHDAPDVRIFMKRRRKVIKRPPTTIT